MQRKYLSSLTEWLISTRRKPLVIRGARQVGKTWLVRQLAKDSGKLLIEFNFEKKPKLVDLFDTNDVAVIIRNLESHINQAIDPSNSLLFLDEIQSAPILLAKLRWFAEDMPELAVIATGSLLDFALRKHTFSMPVGRISYMYLQPMTFEEFLLATEREQQYHYLQNWQLDQKIPGVLHETFCNAIREYVLVGGMPAAINAWRESKSFIAVDQAQQDLFVSYRDDFSKYETRVNKGRLDEVLQAVPDLLGRKFVYSKVNNNVQANTVRQALDLLVMARLVHKTYCCDAIGAPLKAHIDSKMFKTILIDVGLASAALKLALHKDMLSSGFSLSNIGGIAEQFVGQALLSTQPYYQDPEIYYWAREKKNSSAEIDYIIQNASKILPIEVKAGSTGTLRSLHLFMELRNLDLAVRINSDFPSMVDINNYKLLSLPFYLVGQLPRILQQDHR